MQNARRSAQEVAPRWRGSAIRALPLLLACSREPQGQPRVGARGHDQEDLHFLSYAVVGWVDALSRTIYKDIVVESLAHCQQAKGLQLYAWCIMSNHVHLIAKTAEGFKLQDIMRDHKKFTAKRLVEAVEQNGQESRKEWMLPLL